MKKLLVLLIVIGISVFSFWNGMRYQRYLHLYPQVPREEELLPWFEKAVGVSIYTKNRSRDTYYLKGDDVMGFYKLIEFDKDKLPKFSIFHIPKSVALGHCMCDGEFSVVVGKMRFTLHHMESLRWRAAPWDGDAPLSPKSSEALKAWFLDHGFDLFEPVAGGDATR